MPIINITTSINAPIERCFNLALSIDLHADSTLGTNEKVIGGISSGIIKQDETVTWQAKHFGIKQELTTLITKVDFPTSFEDKMIKGAFKNFYHVHSFEKIEQSTIMKDVFKFESPFGIAGKLFNVLVLTNYMIKFLTQRNQVIKKVAESEEWRKYLKDTKF